MRETVKSKDNPRLSAVIEANSEYSGDHAGMNKKKAKSSVGADFKSNMMFSDIEKEEEDDDGGDILAELKKLQEFDSDGFEVELKKRRLSRSDLNA